ncbi:MAG: tetratricopeptide repeat protein [Lishizhenia sp.]
MKLIIVITTIFVGFSSFSQSWEDSLRVGKELYKNKEYNKAYDKFISAQQNAPEDIVFNYEIGNSAYRNGDFETAEKVFLNEFNTSENKQKKSILAQNLGNAQFQQKKYEDAIESYKKALRLDTKNEAARYNLAEAKRRLIKQQETEQKQQNSQEKKDQEDHTETNKEKDKEDGGNQNNSNENRPNKSNNEKQELNQTRDKLSSKKTERMLDELMEKEIKTKQKIQGSLSGEKNSEVKSGKKW